jgi:hypothetical protein
MSRFTCFDNPCELVIVRLGESLRQAETSSVFPARRRLDSTRDIVCSNTAIGKYLMLAKTKRLSLCLFPILLTIGQDGFAWGKIW